MIYHNWSKNETTDSSQFSSTTALVHTSEATCQWLFPVPHLINNRRVKCTSPARSEGKCCCLWQESILLWYGSREKRKKEEPTEDSMQAWSRLCHIILTWRAGWKPCCYRHWISRINSAGLLSFQPRLLHKPLVCGFRLCHYFSAFILLNESVFGGVEEVHSQS